MIDPDRSQRLVDALARKGVNQPCPRCGSRKFGVVDEADLRLGGVERPQTVLPTVVVACDNCGFVTLHATGALDVPELEAANG